MTLHLPHRRILGLVGLCAVTFADPAAAAPSTPAASYEAVAAGPWRITTLNDRPFAFYEGVPAAARLRQEYEAQGLMTPTWKTNAYFPRRTGVAEWGWILRPDGGNKRQCYEWVKRYYLGEKAARYETGTVWQSHTGHEWLSPYAAEWGADLLALEVGENIVGTQAQVAMLRGAARLHALPFCYDVSPWYLTIAAYQAGADETVAADPSRETAATLWGWGPYHYNGGHSSSLLSRLWYLGWLSGAIWVYPEGAGDNFFARDLSRPNSYYLARNTWVPKDPGTRAVLSSLGRRAQAFMRVSRQHPDVGIPHTPFLLMLDHFAGFNGYHYLAPRPWQVLEAGAGDREIWAFLDTVFPGSLERDLVAGVNDDWYNPATEHRRLVNSRWGDSFDTLLSPRPHGALGQATMTKDDPMYPDLRRYQAMVNAYPVVILLGDHEFPFETLKVLAAYLKQGGEVWMSRRQREALGPKYPVLKSVGKLDVYDMAGIPELMDRLAAAHLPVEVKGDVEYLINRTRTGWLVGLINNAGITKEPRGPVVIDPAKRQTVTLRLKTGTMKSAYEWTSEAMLPLTNNAVSVSVDPGEVRIVECIL